VFEKLLILKDSLPIKLHIRADETCTILQLVTKSSVIGKVAHQSWWDARQAKSL